MFTLRPGFDPLQRDGDGHLRPKRAAQVTALETMAYFTAYSASAPRYGTPHNAGFEEIERLAGQLEDARVPLAPADMEFLIELAEEAGRCITARQKGEMELLAEVTERRWSWVMDWGPTVEEWEAERSVPERTGSPRDRTSHPPAAPPRADEPRFVFHILSTYEALSHEQPESLALRKAEVLAAWYSSSARVHRGIQDALTRIPEYEQKRDQALQFGNRTDADRAQQQIEWHKRELEQMRAFLHGESAPPAIPALHLPPGLGAPAIWNFDGKYWTQVTEGKRPLLGVFTETPDEGTCYQLDDRLLGLQRWVQSVHESADEAERAELLELSFDAQECIEALDERRFADVQEIFDERWSWILESLDLDALADVPVADLAPLLVPLPDGPPPAVPKHAPKGAGKVEQSRHKLQSKVQRALEQARKRQPSGPVPFYEVRLGVPGAWGVAWDDVRTGGDLKKVRKHLEEVEKDLEQWVSKSRKDDTRTLRSAKDLRGKVAAACTAYEKGAYEEVMVALGQIRTWILSGSSLPSH